VPTNSGAGVRELEARVDGAIRERGSERQAADVARFVLQRESGWDRRVDLFAKLTGVRLNRQQLATLSPLATVVKRKDEDQTARREARRVKAAEAKRLEVEATAGAHERGDACRASAIAQAEARLGEKVVPQSESRTGVEFGADGLWRPARARSEHLAERAGTQRRVDHAASRAVGRARGNRDEGLLDALRRRVLPLSRTPVGGRALTLGALNHRGVCHVVVRCASRPCARS